MNANAYTETANVTQPEWSGHANEQARRYSNAEMRRQRASFPLHLGRWLVTAIVLVVATLALCYWAKFSIEADAASRAEPETQASITIEPFEYFPAQYVNRAKDREEHIQAF